jgi:hypothetical protein
MRDDPIFICGFPKSGTTLVSQMFSNLPDVMIDKELHFASWMWVMMYQIGNSGGIQTDLHDHLSVRLRELAANDFALFYQYFKDLFCKLHTGYALGLRWGNNCKPTIDHVARVWRIFPAAKIIFMLRDPRDVWASVKHAQWPGQEHFTDFHFFKIRYREMYDRAQCAGVETLLYRDVITDPQIAFDLIGEEFRPEHLAGTGEIFRYRTLPIRYGESFADGLIRVHDQRYKTELSAQEIADIEASFPDVLTRYDF